MVNYFFVAAQQTDTTIVESDSTQNITVQALYSNAKWKEVPAAIAILTTKQVQYFSEQSIVTALNTVSGVRMEERSPGSYRLSIRGSLLRSPFGVRNVKIYWNDLPLSDGGGNTYLNLIETQNIDAAEVLKGPSASIYGAGTGGVLLLKSELPFKLNRSANISIVTGAYGLFKENIQWMYSKKKYSMQLMQSHQQSDGYRQQSALNKNVLQYNGAINLKKHSLELLAFYTSLYYQTPGGITYEQMLQNPTLARQATATLPSAVLQQTAVYNNSFFIALKHVFKLSSQLETQTAIVLSGTDFANPFITNYEIRKEKNTAFSSKLFYKKLVGNIQLKWVTGFEYLRNRSAIDNYGNRNGQRDTVQYKDAVKANQWFVFSQLNATIGKFNFQLGMSCNEQFYAYKRLSDVSFGNYKNAYTKIVATPRLAISYQLHKNVSVYGLVAKGFSPPTLAEIKPSDGNFYSDLKAEYGYNFEAGIKGYLLQKRLQFDIALYHFTLNDAIVRRNNAAGAEYFVNAGNTIQKGVESILKYQLLKNTGKYFNTLNISNSNSFQPYRFTNYVVGNANFSGNALTGVPKYINVTTVEAMFKKRYSISIIYNYTASIPLTDGNDAFAMDYRLLQAKINYHFAIQKSQLSVFISADNLLNETYSLGNDINAAGKRYYNPAPQRNFLTGISVRLL